MTSYGGATNLVRWAVSAYRMPGSARRSAIGVSAELHGTQVRHSIDLTKPLQDIRADRIIDSQDHHGVASRTIAPNLHARDVDVVLAEDGANAPDQARPVRVPADQEAAGRHEVDPERVDPDGARLAHHHRAGELVSVDAQRDPARLTSAGGTAPLDQLHAPARCDQPRIDLVDAIFGEGLKHALDRCRDQQV